MAETGRIAAGQKLSSAVSARAWNRAQDAADIVLGSRGNLLAGASSTIERASNVVLVLNVSGYPVPVGGALAINGVENDPGDGDLEATEPTENDFAVREFVRRPLVRGTRVESVSDLIAVALEPVAINKIGRFACGGVFPCKVRILSSGHRFATGRYRDVTQLVSAECGPVELLFKGGPEATAEEPDTTPYWSLGKM